ncbi:MAG TPA: bifunctional glutamate N-acetyltransferase/amino-acid acetyltransferase ArgJ [Candidatus Udaeobacter sp.]|nr:bifunctional glutamate N-acetyltransferase/amino-acid acetyltransferase ArgJ [Candidatus Udaeobacter sp.]
MSHSEIFKRIEGSICAPRGFKAAAVFCDIKRLGTGKGSEKGRKGDLGLIVSDASAAVAGMFTTNQVCAAPVKLSASRAAKRFARAIVVNSGNANACTGRRGIADAKRMTETTATVLNLREGDVLVCSTGRIGVLMPMKNVERGIRACAPLLARSETNARQAAEAIMTTDTCRKEIAIELKIGTSTVRIGGICKGAGMIQPGMTARHATMLAFITTDVAIEPKLLKHALRIAVEQSFDRITVDGDMSTNDSVIALANGCAGNPRIGSRLSGSDRDSKFGIFQAALNVTCLELAKMIVRDGEGASRFVALHIHGARNAAEAEAAARAIANSSLVKVSWCGGDPNWGRILCALGYSKARVNESLVDIGYAKPGSREMLFAFRRGQPTNLALKTLARITSAPEFELHVNLHLGRAAFTMWASDLTEDYVAFNKGNVSDPATLGG